METEVTRTTGMAARVDQSVVNALDVVLSRAAEQALCELKAAERAVQGHAQSALRLTLQAQRRNLHVRRRRPPTPFSDNSASNRLFASKRSLDCGSASVDLDHLELASLMQSPKKHGAKRLRLTVADAERDLETLTLNVSPAAPRPSPPAPQPSPAASRPHFRSLLPNSSSSGSGGSATSCRSIIRPIRPAFVSVPSDNDLGCLPSPGSEAVRIS